MSAEGVRCVSARDFERALADRIANAAASSVNAGVAAGALHGQVLCGVP